MKKYFYNFMVFVALGLLGICCDDDTEKTVLADVRFSGKPMVTPDAIVLTPDNKYESVTTISWADVDYPVDAPVTYALQFDVASDTIGASAWENAIRIPVGEAVLARSFLGAELNDIAKDLGLAVDVPGELVVRAEAYLDRTVYSHASKITVTPFVEIITATQLYMPGQYQGWQPATAATLDATEAGVFRGYITFPAGQLEFKFTETPNWDVNYGKDDNGNLVADGPHNLVAPAPGSYEVTVNLNTMTYTLTPYSWGVIGTATAGGWNSDTDMTYDYVDKVWTFTGNLVSGALKWRLNDSWTVNYGPINNTDGIAYFDNQGAHTIGVAGTYIVTFALDADPATAHYTVTMQ